MTIDPLENLDMALVYVSECQTRADEPVLIYYPNEFPKVFARDQIEFKYFLEILSRQGWLDLTRNENDIGDSARLTPEGWAKVEQIKKVQIDSDQAFVAMWFDDQLLGAWEEGFEPALTATGFKPLRVDLAQYNGKIDDYIVAQIRRSGLIVADFTGHRGGVYFEAGFALGLGIRVILTCKDTDVDGLHFDTRQYNHILWATPQELRDKLQNRIAATIPGRTIVLD